jgi:hypothetical protein
MTNLDEITVLVTLQKVRESDDSTSFKAKIDHSLVDGGYHISGCSCCMFDQI